MKLLFIIILVLTSCGRHKPLEPKSSREMDQLFNGSEPLNGVIEFDLLSLKTSGESCLLLNYDNTTFAEFDYNKLKIGDKTYDLKEDNEKFIKSLLNIHWFYPSFDIMIADCIKETKDFYEISIGSTTKFVSKKTKYIKFTSYKDFLSNKTFKLDKNCPLKDSPNDSSRIVAGYEMFGSYQIIEFWQEWIKVKPDYEVYGNLDFNGWCRWEKDKKLQIDDIHFSF